MNIQVWDRQNSAMVVEKVFGDSVLDFLYNSKLGRTVVRPILAGSKTLNYLYGLTKDTKRSRLQIPDFVTQYNIDLTEYEEKDYQSFNDFFIRRFQPGERPFAGKGLVAFCEARYSVVKNLNADSTLPVKGTLINPAELLDNDFHAEEFIGGTAIVARLCPADYHRFHFPDRGRVDFSYEVSGVLDSVNPEAIAACPRVFLRNERHVSLLDCDELGRVAMVEVGALCVGRIQQTHTDDEFSRGDEKGYFLFGGSTVVVLLSAGCPVQIDPDILELSRKGIETFVRLGEQIGS